MRKFNDGNPYHGSPEVMEGRLRGATVDTDYFYFFCPRCPDNQKLDVVEYTVRRDDDHGFAVAFKLYCYKCDSVDFVKIGRAWPLSGSEVSRLSQPKDPYF